MVLSDNTVKKMFNYILLCNCFFKLRNKLFQQVIGILLQILQICFSTVMRISWLKNKKTDIERARCFRNVFRFIDDLSELIGCGELERCI